MDVIVKNNSIAQQIRNNSCDRLLYFPGDGHVTYVSTKINEMF
jgi:hypothetical protein